MFAQKKQQILSEISSTDESSPDASPKGTIDEAIIPLIDIINQSADFVTTSSCSGRVSVFLEGVKSPSKIGGKGLGGKWLYVTHDKRELRENNCNWWQDQVKNHKEKEEEVGIEVTDDTTRYVIYKFEPMILHVKCRTHEAACRLYSTAMGCGFRETGIGSNDMVAIRISMKLDLPVACLKPQGLIDPLVPDNYIQVIDKLSLDLFEKNEQKISDLSKAIEDMCNTAEKNIEVETKEQRRVRKRAEGLKRQQEKMNATDTDTNTQSM